MKRISRSLLSLCLALLLCASLLPAGLTAKADTKTSYQLTGYTAIADTAIRKIIKCKGRVIRIGRIDLTIPVKGITKGM